MKDIVRAVFEIIGPITFFCMVATLKKRHIQKIKKTPGDIKKLLNPKYDPNRSSSSRDIRYDRQTDRQTSPPPKITFFEF